jgi:PAS domain S-box-containing protein
MIKNIHMDQNKSIADLKIEDLIDISLFQKLQDNLNEINPFPSALIDNDGKIHTATAWQDICTKFHRKNHECEKECIKSDQYIIDHIHEANPAVIYTCPHGLTDTAIPLIFNGRHLANFFTGQFFIKNPDPEFFRNQAKKYGFNEKEYLKAVSKTPVWTKEKMQQYHNIIKTFSEIIIKIGQNSLTEKESRKEYEDAIREKNESLRLAQEASKSGTWDWDIVNNRFYWSEEFLKLFALPEVTIPAFKIWSDCLHPDDLENASKKIQEAIDQNIELLNDYRILLPEGEIRWIRAIGKTYYSDEGKPLRIAGLCTDITKIKLTEEALQKSGDRYRGIIQTSLDGFWIVDLKGDITEVNEAYSKMIGYSYDELLKMNISQIEVIEKTTDIINHLKQVIETGSDRFESKHRRKDGNIIDVEIRANCIPTEKSIFVFVHDITNRKRIEVEFRNNQEKLELALSSAEMGIWYFDIIEGKRTFDKQTCLLLGIDQAKFKGTEEEFLQVLHPDDRNKVRKSMQKTISSNVLYTPEYRVQWKENTVKYLTARGKLIKSPEGEPLGILGILWDITELRYSEEKIRENEEIFHAFLEHSPVYIFFKDKDLRSVKLSKNYEKMLGMPMDKLLNKTMDEIFPSELARSMMVDDLKILNGKEVIDVEEELGGRNYETVKFPIRKDGEPFMLAGFTVDVTNRHKSDSLLQKKMKELERFNSLTVGREVRMIELKAEVNELLARLGEEKKYRIVK